LCQGLETLLAKSLSTGSEALLKKGDIQIRAQYGPGKKKTRRISNKQAPKIPKRAAKWLRLSQSKNRKRARRRQRWRIGLWQVAHLASAPRCLPALKIMSIARFLAATGGDPLPRIKTWHTSLMRRGSPREACYELRKAIGADEATT